MTFKGVKRGQETANRFGRLRMDKIVGANFHVTIDNLGKTAPKVGSKGNIVVIECLAGHSGFFLKVRILGSTNVPFLGQSKDRADN